MFTGIVECLGKVENIIKEGSNIHFQISSSITSELQIDQSVSHNGVCLTVVEIIDNSYTVTAINETLIKSNLGQLKKGDSVNLERSLTLEKRLDGHMVQGHVDTTARCLSIEEEAGSWIYRFEVQGNESDLIVDKGSICINGTSLTIFNIKENTFSVAIIPYTYENTIFHSLKTNDMVNIEFDMMGKYIVKYLKGLNLK